MDIFLISAGDIGLSDIRHGGKKCSDMGHSLYLNSTCEIGENKWQRRATLPFLKIDMRHRGPPSRPHQVPSSSSHILLLKPPTPVPTSTFTICLPDLGTSVTTRLCYLIELLVKIGRFVFFWCLVGSGCRHPSGMHQAEYIYWGTPYLHRSRGELKRFA